VSTMHPGTGRWPGIRLCLALVGGSLLAFSCGTVRNGTVALTHGDLLEDIMPGAEARVFVARVDAVAMASSFSGKAIVIDTIDGNWILSVTVLQVLKGEGGLAKAGVKPDAKVSFMIHSPARTLHLAGEEAVGRTFVFNWLERAEQEGVPSRTLVAVREVKP